MAVPVRMVAVFMMVFSMRMMVFSMVVVMPVLSVSVLVHTFVHTSVAMTLVEVRLGRCFRCSVPSARSSEDFLGRLAHARRSVAAASSLAHPRCDGPLGMKRLSLWHCTTC